MLTALATELPLLVVHTADKSPQPEDVKAGWTAFTIFLLLLVAVALLGWSLVRQLRKAQAAKDAGVYGDEAAAQPVDGPAEQPAEDPGTGTTDRS